MALAEVISLGLSLISRVRLTVLLGSVVHGAANFN